MAAAETLQQLLMDKTRSSTAGPEIMDMVIVRVHVRRHGLNTIFSVERRIRQFVLCDSRSTTNMLRYSVYV